MIEALLILMLAFVGLVIVPLLLIGLLVKGLVAIVVLPFRLLGAVLGAAAGAAGFVAKLLFGLVAVLFGIVVTAGALVLLPLIPILFLVGGIWLLARLARPRPQPVH